MRGKANLDGGLYGPKYGRKRAGQDARGCARLNEGTGAGGQETREIIH